MSIDPLTARERQFIETLPEHLGGMQLRRAVTVIDAQAAAIERVRAAMATLEDIVRVHGEDTTISAEALLDDLREALTAAPALHPACLAELGAKSAQADRHERAVLSALEQAMKRSGDDPPYYECDFEMCGELARLNPGLPAAVNEYCAELARRETAR